MKFRFSGVVCDSDLVTVMSVITPLAKDVSLSAVGCEAAIAVMDDVDGHDSDPDRVEQAVVAPIAGTQGLLIQDAALRIRPVATKPKKKKVGPRITQEIFELIKAGKGMGYSGSTAWRVRQCDTYEDYNAWRELEREKCKAKREQRVGG